MLFWHWRFYIKKGKIKWRRVHWKELVPQCGGNGLPPLRAAAGPASLGLRDVEVQRRDAAKLRLKH